MSGAPSSLIFRRCRRCVNPVLLAVRCGRSPPVFELPRLCGVRRSPAVISAGNQVDGG